jgi:hypothetical protein
VVGSAATADVENMNRSQLRNVLLFAASGFLAVAVTSRPGWSLFWVQYATYFTMFGATGAFLVRWFAWARARWTSPAAAVRANAPEILLGLGAMAALFLTHDWQFKVLSDETNMVAVARSLAHEWRFDFPGQSKFYFGAHHFSNYVFDKRPPLFTFVLSLVDALAGYRVRNVWLLNGALLGATIVVTAGALKRRLGRPWNLLALVWAIANPLVMQTASAAGVEPILCLMWAIAGLAMLETLEDPESASFPLLVAAVMLLGLARLEAGPMAALMLGGAIFASPERKKLIDRFRDDWLVWCAPAVALPVAIQKARLKDYFQGTTTKPFALEHLVANVSNWRRVLLDGGRSFPFNTVVTTAEVIAFVVLVVLVLTRRTKMSRAERTAFLVFAALTTALVALYSTYYWGQPTKATSARFYALPLFFAGLTVPAVLKRIPAVEARAAPAAVVFALVFAHAFPAAYDRTFVNTLPWRRAHEIVDSYLLPRISGRSVLLVTPHPGQFLVYDVGAISFKTFNAERKNVLREIDRKLYDEVLFAQELSFSDKKPVKGSALDPSITLETVLERQYTATSFIRISRFAGVGEVTAPTEAPATEPAATEGTDDTTAMQPEP